MRSVLAVIVFAALASAAPASAVTPGGTALVASATLTYQDARGASYGLQSNALSTTVAAVGALVVAPKETAADPAVEGFAAGSAVTRTFTITNASNVRDAYTVSAVDLTAGTIASMAFVQNGVEAPCSIGSGVSAPVAPGETIALRVTVQTAGVLVGTAVSLTVHVRTTASGTANGVQSDYGRSFGIASSGPSITGPGGPGAPVDKTVDGARSVQRAAGARVHYAISFANTGGAPAANVVVDDPVPPQLHPDPASITVNGTAATGASLANAHVTVGLPSLAVGAHAVVGFDAIVDGGAPLGSTIANTATIRADGLAPVTSLPATIFVGNAGIVYDGIAATGTPVGGAIVALVDPTTSSPLTLPASGVAPNTGDADPFTAGADGSYAFALPTGATHAPVNAVLTVTAQRGYQNRRIAVSYVPDTTGTLGTLTATALDGQPLGIEGGYALVNRAVVLRNVAGIWPNVPLFPARVFSLTLSADRAFASAGDRVVYTATLQSTEAMPSAAARVLVTLPAGLAFAPGTARFDGAVREPQRTGRTYAWDLPAADAAPHTLRFATVVLPSVEAGRTLTTLASADVSAGPASLDASASTDVRIVAGALSDRGIVTGRVYAVTKGRRVGVAGVRVYREDGASVVTDALGRFSFLGMRPGMHVVRLDPASLPPGFTTFADDRDDERRATTRLVHGILDSGGLEDVEFEVRPL